MNGQKENHSIGGGKDSEGELETTGRTVIRKKSKKKYEI
jgi:hypothetical protein